MLKAVCVAFAVVCAALAVLCSAINEDPSLKFISPDVINVPKNDGCDIGALFAIKFNIVVEKLELLEIADASS